jgi:glycosyltransferase involved in cell wall biosynthesis
MRIVIDMQGAQGEHRFDATGRAALALAHAIVRQSGPREVVLALNGLFPATINAIRALFDDVLPQEKIMIWYTPGPLAAQVAANAPRRALAESLREGFLASLEGDVILVMSLVEGYASDAVTSIGSLTIAPPVAVLVHDLRPLQHAMLIPDPDRAEHFRSKIGSLANAACVLAMDAAGAADATALLGRDAIDLSDGQLAPAGWDDMARRTLDALDALVSGVGGQVPVSSGTELLEQLIARVPDALGPCAGAPADNLELRRWAHALSRFPQEAQTRQLFVDVSELVCRDARTGVQRVTRSILNALLDSPPAGYVVAPVYTSDDTPGYRYAHAFTAAFLDAAVAGPDAPIDYRAGDVLLGLDLVPHLVPRRQPFLQAMRRDGVSVWFVVYDLLPVLMPQYFPPGTEDGHRTWLTAISACDGAVCISRAVAQELATWQQAHVAPRLRPFDIAWFHLGADVHRSVPSRGMPDNAGAVLAAIGRRPTFLAVGTIEPRKQYGQLLAAFELLWASGIDVNVVMIGKQGWMMDQLAARLRAHPENGKRLFWLEGISDEYLEQVYAACTCLIAPSLGEGFGLPLIEAAQHKLPILARDLPVFREVGGEHAMYFRGAAPQDLATAINAWLALDATGMAPPSTGLAWLSWADSTRQLMHVALRRPERAAQLLVPLPAAPRRPRVLTLAPYPVRRPRHGGQLRAAALIRVYEAAGFDVHPVGFYQAEAYGAADIGAHDIAFPADSPFRRYLGVAMPALSDFLMGPFAVASDAVFRQITDGLPGPVDVIQVEQPWMYALARWLQLASPLCRGALLVNSSHNIEAPMKRAILAPHADPALIDLAVADMSAVERELAHEAELSLAVTVEDAEALRTYGAPCVLHAANGISPWHAAPERCAHWRTRLPQQPWAIFIASAHPPNYTGFLDAIGDSLACIPAGSKLVIAGGVGLHLERELGKSPWSELNLSRLQVLGVLDDADLAAVKSLAHAFLLPIGGGGGSNIKTAEALYSGRPVVCTRTALRGFERFAGLPEVTVAETPEQFQQGIRKVLEAPLAVSAAGAAMRASLTWDACLAAVPQEVTRLLAAKRERA